MAKSWAPGTQQAQGKGQNFGAGKEGRRSQNTYSRVKKYKLSAIHTALKPCLTGGMWELPEDSR